MTLTTIPRLLTLSLCICLGQPHLHAAEPGPTGSADISPDRRVRTGADECTPSLAMYFSWINNTNEGSTEQQTLTNLEFFRWMREQYGLQLDVYCWDAGNLDDAYDHPRTMQNERFKRQYPHGWKPLMEAAERIGCRLGIWNGPDGFGNTPESAQARTDMLAGICRDFHMRLFKFDSVGSNLRPEKRDDFINMLKECRRYSPDLVVLTHRLNLGKAADYVTTSLFGGETYIDVENWNSQTAPHHRAGQLARPLPPGLTRMLEDHGVCLSAGLDGWEDDLVLQAFNRCLLMSPELYGNPWLLRDDEFPKLARFFNLHRRYRDILTRGLELPKEQYGPYAVSRGDDSTRLITLRNLSWQPVTYQVKLDDSIGLKNISQVTLRRFHPHEQILGQYPVGSTVPVCVPPFSSCLLMASATPGEEIGVRGCDAEIVRNQPGKPVLLKLIGPPGTKATATLVTGSTKFLSATVAGQPSADFAQGQPTAIAFPGQAPTQPVHRKLADLTSCPVPADAEALFEATCFAADNNALEYRSLRRSGPTQIPQVQAARDAFFAQELLRTRSCSDQLLFEDTPLRLHGWWHWPKVLGVQPTDQLRLDFGCPIEFDQLTLHLQDGTTSAQAEVATDWSSWTPVKTTAKPKEKLVVIESASGKAIRYLRLNRGTMVINQIDATQNGRPLSRANWRCSSLFPGYAANAATAAWSATVTLTEAAPKSYLCIALDGEHGEEGAWVSARLNGKPIGCPDRAPSFKCYPWQARVRPVAKNYTYYLPVTPAMIGQPLDLVALTLKNGKNQYKPSLWITSRVPESSVEVQLETSTVNRN